MKKALIGVIIILLAGTTYGQRITPDTSFAATLIDTQWCKKTWKLSFLTETKDSVFLFEPTLSYSSGKAYVLGKKYLFSYQSTRPRKRVIQGKLSTKVVIKEL